MVERLGQGGLAHDSIISEDLFKTEEAGDDEDDPPETWEVPPEIAAKYKATPSHAFSKPIQAVIAGPSHAFSQPLLTVTADQAAQSVAAMSGAQSAVLIPVGSTSAVATSSAVSSAVSTAVPMAVAKKKPARIKRCAFPACYYSSDNSGNYNS